MRELINSSLFPLSFPNNQYTYSLTLTKNLGEIDDFQTGYSKANLYSKTIF
jgi:hypothetical protein